LPAIGAGLPKIRKSGILSLTACTPHSILENHRRMAGVATDFPRHYQGLPCPTLLNSAVGPPLKQPIGHRRGSLPTGWAACGCLLPLWTPTPYAHELFNHYCLPLQILFLDRFSDFILSFKSETLLSHLDREFLSPSRALLCQTLTHNLQP
jgi:hypothetical protein